MLKNAIEVVVKGGRGKGRILVQFLDMANEDKFYLTRRPSMTSYQNLP